MRRMIARASAVAGVLLWASTAGADPCNRPDLRAAMPPADATDVPTNVWLQALYATSAEYQGEEILLVQIDGETRSLVGTFDAAEGLLSVTPPELLPGATYEIRWPALRGIATASKGDGATIRFEVGTRADTRSPEFAGLADLKWDWEHKRDDCSEATDDRYVFELGIGEATDDGGHESLTLLVFQTKGPKIDVPVPVHVGALPDPGERVVVTRTVEEAVGELCFSALVRDLTGQVAGGSAEEVCVDTRPPPFFNGCAVASTPGSTSGSTKPSPAKGAWVAGVLLAAAVSRRRWSRHFA